MCNTIDSAISRGVKIGEAVGEARLAALIMLLYSCNKQDEAARACRDKAYRHDLYAKYHIV